MTPDPPLPPGKRYTYVQWGDCSKCSARFPMTLNMVRKAQGLVGKPELPKCQKCRNAVKVRRMKRDRANLGGPECRFAGKIAPGTLKKMHLRRAPASGTPSLCPLMKRYYLRYFVGRGRKVTDEQRAYLDATDEEAAIEEARDWYTRALLHGAQWLPEDFYAEATQSDDLVRTRKILEKMRKKNRRTRPPRRVTIEKRQVRSYIMVDRFTVYYNGKTVKGGLTSREEAHKVAKVTRKKHKIHATEPSLKPCLKCGVKPVWQVGTLIHEGDEYCPNRVMLQDKRFTRRTKIALWNTTLRHGDYGGWWDFRFEHVLLMEKIRRAIPDAPPAHDPLEGFEI
jgi:1,2-phenylacetyl-CoA epoxidase PaaB subunit